MSRFHSCPPRARLLLCALSLLAATPATLRAQEPAATPSVANEPVADLPITAEERRRFVGLYSIRGLDDPEAAPLSLRIFEQGDAVMGSMGGNDPTRMLYQGDNVFRPQAAMLFVVTFTLEADRATRVSIVSPDGAFAGVRIDDDGAGGAEIDASAMGALYDELAAMDGVLFDAIYVACDAGATTALLTDDAEFYHDRNGFQSGQALRDSFASLVESCPREQGVTRELVADSLRVYPIRDYGAVQTGVHRFVETGARTHTVARFVHLWRQTADGWRISRVLSFDHRRESDTR